MLKPKEERKIPIAVSLCHSCFCGTHTIKGKCGKCGADKPTPAKEDTWK